jgi:uncharacterized protein YggT (Ycf19 family)
MLLLSRFFKLVYFILLIRACTNYLRYKQFQPAQPLKFLLSMFEKITDIFCKPFQNILYVNYDLSPIIAIAFIHYLAEPVAEFLFRISMQTLLLFIS